MIPTAREIMLEDESGVYSEMDIVHMMIKFAKLHVQEALRQASEQAEVNYELNNPYDANSQYAIVDKKSILTAYSLDNIK